VLVESVIVVPLVFLLLLGTMQGGLLMKSYSSSGNAVRGAGRVASIAGADPVADQRILDRLHRDAAGLGRTAIRSVVIWHATGPGDPVPAGCQLTPGANPNTSSLGVGDAGIDALGACNVYLNPDAPGGAFAMAGGTASQPSSYYFGCQGPLDPQAAHMVDCSWPGKDRKALTSPRSSTSGIVSPDFVGVWIQLVHTFPVRMPMQSVTITQSSITLIEPQGYSF
jgi:hypothetical protein